MSRYTEQHLFESLMPLVAPHGQAQKLAEVSVGTMKLPIWALTLGSADKTLPCFGLFGGVHGLERVGSHVVLNFLKAFLQQLQWDENLQSLMQHMRIVTIPLVNPGGLYLSTRANPQGVDIMRNAPIESDEQGLAFVSGQKISPRIPWYRGSPESMETETNCLIEFVKKEMLPSAFSMALDIHSGFGLRDRLWYPYSHTRKSFPYEPTVYKFKNLLKTALPHHVYKIEKQTDSYLIHGDPWDYLFEEHKKTAMNNSTFIPWCLEMGSWTWLKKNPMQILSKPGLFNPILPHRYSRIMRRHRGLLDIFIRSTLNHKNWNITEYSTQHKVTSA